MKKVLDTNKDTIFIKHSVIIKGEKSDVNRMKYLASIIEDEMKRRNVLFQDYRIVLAFLPEVIE